MIPKVASGGKSFKGAFRYYFHDKGSDSADRVDWTSVRNISVDDPASAWRLMAYTAKAQLRLKEAAGQARTGRKLENPVFAFSLSWHPDQEPTKEHMVKTADAAIEMLALTEHQAVLVAHNDEPHKHVHIILNRVHPVTGKAGDIRNYKRKFSNFARKYENSHNQVLCPQREENHQKRQKGEITRYRDPVIRNSWESTTTGKEFIQALASKGYTLAHGRKRLIVIDANGRAINPTRHIPNIKAKDIKTRLQDVELEKLPIADQLAESKPKDRENSETAPRQQSQSSNPQISLLQERQELELENLQLQYEKRMLLARERLSRYHDLEGKKAEIQKSIQKMRERPWWKKLLRIDRPNWGLLSDRVRNYKRSRKLYRDSLRRIHTELECAKAELKQQHERSIALIREHAKRVELMGPQKDLSRQKPTINRIRENRSFSRER
jgi:hypothetical protein